MKILYLVGLVLAALALADAEPVAEPNAEAGADPTAAANAEAEADPWYSAYGYGLRHYGGYARPYYGGYYRGYGLYGKRSADAEPIADANAEANADPWYRAYGYGRRYYGYGHGYYGGYRGYRGYW